MANDLLTNFFLKQKTLWLIFVAIFLLLLLITEKYSQSFHFVDEDEYLTIANYINHNYRLYTDLSSNHQPIVYFLSSTVQQIVKPNTLYNLMKVNRETVYVFSLVFSLILVHEFGTPFLIFSFIYETTKFFIFGNLLLAESLVVYPLIYIFGLSFSVIFLNKKVSVFGELFFGLCNFIILFTLLPAIPSLVILDILLIYKLKNFKKILIGFLFPTILLFIFINPKDYFHETIFNNYKYAIPLISPIKNPLDILKLFMLPILSFTAGLNSILNRFLQFLTLWTFICFIFVVKGKNRQSIIPWLIFLFSALLLNSRNLVAGEMFYGGFHLLPWYAAIILLNVFTFYFLLKKKKEAFLYFFILILFLFALPLFVSKDMPYFIKINKVDDHNTNFLSYYLIGKAINSVADKNDKMAVLPDEVLIYWQSQTIPATKQTVYYEWQYHVPELREKMDEVFMDNPPEFIYADFKRIGSPTSYLPLLNNVLNQKYWQATRNGIAQNLYIKKDKVKEITNEQWLKWQNLAFDKITL